MIVKALMLNKVFLAKSIEKLSSPRFLHMAIPLSVIIVISRAFPLFSPIYYALPFFLIWFIVSGLKSFLTDKRLKTLIMLFIIFGIWAGLTTLWSDFPSVSLSRSIYFIFIFFGAVLGGYLWQQVSSDLLSFLLPANIIIISLCLFSLITNIPAESWSGGNGKGFMGFAGHQNTLASAILFTIPATINKIPFLKGNKRDGLIMLLILNLLILLFTYSRASILALVCSVIIFLILNKKWNVLIYSSAVTLLILSLIWFSPSLKMEANKFVKKDFPTFYSTREWMWEPSYRAAISDGIFGLGYGISNQDIIVHGTGSYFNNGRYIREKGNSFLALIEEVGVIGFVLFLLPLAYFLKTYRARSIRHSVTSSIFHFPSSIIISSLATFIIHSQFEAWMVGVGSIQLPLFFFYIGCLIHKNLPLAKGDSPYAIGTEGFTS